MNQKKKHKSENIYISEIDEKAWVNNIHEFKHSLFISAEWVNAMQNANNKAVFLDFHKNNLVVGKLAGLICDYGGFSGRQLYFYASPAIKECDQDLFDSCHSALYDYARKHKYSRVILGSYDQQHELSCCAKGYYATNRFEYIVDFRPEAEELHFSKGFRKNVKRAEKNNISFIQSDKSEILEKLFALLEKTREHRISKYGSEYNPYYLQNMNKQSLTRLVDSGIVKLYYVLYNDEVNSVQYNIEKNGQVYGLLMGSDDTAYELGFPSYIDYNMIMRFQDLGFDYYNPGGGTDDAGNAGVEKYKHSMGGIKINVHGATTNYITFPQKMLNPLMNLGRILPRKNPVVKLIKKFI